MSATNKPDSLRPRFASADLISPFIPDVDPKHPRAQKLFSRRDVVLKTASIIAIAVGLTNLIGTILLTAKFRIGDIFRGDCQEASKLNSAIHVLINFLSTLLLGASNLCMQLLAAPTRREVDQAHEKFLWLDIGIPSIRNIRHISKQRQVVWWMLALSSLPLHFL
jgi:hypothetical protein